MNRYGYALLLAALLPLAAAPTRAQWVQANGPIPARVQAIAANETTHFLSADGLLYRSFDGGHVWLNTGLGGTVAQLYPHAEATVYVSTAWTGFFRSTDNLATWAPLPGFTNGNGGAFTGHGDTLFLTFGPTGSTSQLYRSTNNGASWAPVTGGLPSPLYAADLLSLGDVVLAAVDNGLYRSANGGTTWAPVSLGLPSGTYVYHLDGDAAALYAVAAGDDTLPAVFRSLNQGLTWSRVSTNLPTGAGLYPTDFDAEGSTLVLSVANGFAFEVGVWRSTDGGVTWTRVSSGLPGEDATEALLLDEGEVFAGTSQGVYRAPVGGGTWAFTGTGSAAPQLVQALAASGDALVAGSDGPYPEQDLFRSSDGGTSWTTSSNGIGERSIAHDFLHYDGALFAAVYGLDRGVFRSTDGGLTWTRSSTGLSTSTVLEVLFAHEGVLFAGAYEALYRSTDGGATWTVVPGLPANPWIRALATDGAALYAGSYGAGVLRSTDSGLTWTLINAGLGSTRHVVALDASTGTPLAGFEEGVGVRRYNGTSWVPSGLSGSVTLIAPVGDRLLAGGPGLYSSDDGGLTWTPFSDGYTGGPAYDVAIGGDRLFVGAGGVWSRLLTDLLPAAVTVSAAPIAPPVVIPASGGSFEFTVTLTNTTAQPQTVQAWTAVEGPVDRSPVLGPQTVTLAPGASVRRTLTQAVPAQAPPGTYTYRVSVQRFPGTLLDSDDFSFAKDNGAARVGDEVASNTASSEAHDWTVSSWEHVAARPASATSGLPGGFTLSEVSPNPFTALAHVAVEVAETQAMTVAMFDGLGRRVAVLHEGALEAGTHAFALDGSALPAGLYLVRATGETSSTTRRVVLVR